MKIEDLMQLPKGTYRDIEANFSFGGWGNVAEELWKKLNSGKKDNLDWKLHHRDDLLRDISNMILKQIKKSRESFLTPEDLDKLELKAEKILKFLDTKS